jgi:RNA recognition motif-containing protein
MQARVSLEAKDRFKNQYSSTLSSLATRSITSTISGITHTHLGPIPSRVQLLISNLTISTTLDINTSLVKEVHTLDKVEAFLKQLQHLHQSAMTPAPVKDNAPPTVSVGHTAVEMTELLPDHVQIAERNNPSKRPHSQTSPTHSSSHRSVRPRIHNDDEDVAVQTGLNLNQPIQLQSKNAQEGSRLLSLLSARNSAARASTTTNREQALRLGSHMSAQMAPPPVPATKSSDSQAQAPSQIDSQPLSQNFESQIPLAEPSIYEQATRGTPANDNADVQLQAKENTRPKIDLPNNTPTSAQPEPLEVTQSSLPPVPSQRVPVPSQRVPLPSQSEALAASLGTSSSHLLDETSPSSSRSLHRAPPPLFVKYSRRSIPKNQRKLLDKASSWWPSRPGTTFTHPNIPVEDLKKIEEAAERRAAKAEKKERARQIEEENKLLNTLPVTQGTQSSEISWDSSPEHHAQPRYRNDTLRRSTNIVEPEPSFTTPLAKVPLVKLLPGELPPDSSGDHMQVDEPIAEISSSPPVSQEGYDSDVEYPPSPKPNLRQLPEYPLGSPEESAARPNPGTQHADPVLKLPPVREASPDEFPPDELDRASSPILEVAASPQPQEIIEEFTGALEDDVPLVQQHLGQPNNTLSIDDQHQVDNDISMDDQPQVTTGQDVDERPQAVVTGSPTSWPQKHQRSGLELTEEAAELQRRAARIKREFYEQRKKAPLVDPNMNNPQVPRATAQLVDKIEADPELPVANIEPQPDPMEVDETPVDSAKPLDPNAVNRAAIIDQWRRQSDQSDEHIVTAPESEPPEPAVAGSNIPEPAVSTHGVSGPTTSESPVSDLARSATSLSARAPRLTDRRDLGTASVNPLPPKPSHRADMRSRDSDSQIRQEIEKGIFGVPNKALWVGSLPVTITDAQLEQMFAEFNPVSAFAKKKSGFVNFANVDAACRALEAKHNSLFDGKSVVCRFGPLKTPKTVKTLTIDDLFSQMIKERNFKGNRTAFETLCKNLHTSSDVSPSQWDNYVVLQPAEFLPWASRTIANGGKILDYDTYWREHLQKTAKPDLVPMLTPAKLKTIFNKAPAIDTPSVRSSAPTSPQTSPGVRQPRPPLVHRTPPTAPPLAPRSVGDDLRRSVVEGNAQSTTSTPQKVISTEPHPLLNLQDPARTSKWVRQNFTKDSNGRVSQLELYQKYKDDFAGSKVPPMDGGLFVRHVFNTYPGRAVSEIDDAGNKTFYCTGLRYKYPPRSTATENGSPEFKIKGVSTTTSARDRNSEETRSSPDERVRKPSRRSLPFGEEIRQSRSRSPARNPPSRAPRGKLHSPDHLLNHEVSNFLFWDGLS